MGVVPRGRRECEEKEGTIKTRQMQRRFGGCSLGRSEGGEEAQRKGIRGGRMEGVGEPSRNCKGAGGGLN